MEKNDIEKTLKSEIHNKLTIEIVKLKKPVFGGLYAVICRQKDFISNFKDGLCLDAANEIFKNSINQILTNKINNSYK